MPLSILYQDAYFVAVNKPSGLLVHRSAVDRHAQQFALQLVRDQIGQRVYPVHRLDKPTSGVLVFALSPEAARRIGPAFAGGGVAKTYLAVVRGYTDEQGIIDYPLREMQDRMTDTRARTDKPAQPAVTAYRRLATIELPVAVDRYPTSRYSLVETHPKTGRKHQLRRHFKHIAHPIIGDGKYGKGRHNRFFRDRLGCGRLLLAATELSFPHPFTGRPATVTAPLDASFSALLRRLAWTDALPDHWLAP